MKQGSHWREIYLSEIRNGTASISDDRLHPSPSTELFKFKATLGLESNKISQVFLWNRSLRKDEDTFQTTYLVKKLTKPTKLLEIITSSHQ